jgi:alpha-glucosidase (family GH31 glycosyl hydrolase)
MKKTLLFTLFFIFYTFLSFAQNKERKFENVKKNNHQIIIQTNDCQVVISAYQQDIVKIEYILAGKNYHNLPKEEVKFSYNTNIALKENKKELQFVNGKTKVVIEKNPFQIEFYYQNKQILEEERGLFLNNNLIGLSFQLEKNEAIYGTGSRALPFDRRGNRLELYNKAHYAYQDNAPLMNFNIPVVISSQKYALYFDNPQKSFLDLGKTNPEEMTFEAIGGRMAYYFIPASTLQTVTEKYTQFTGLQPLPPLWAFGNFISRYGYHTETETKEVAEKMYEQGFPADAIILDHYWYGEGEVKKNVAMGDLDWYRPKFPNGEQMVKDLAQKGIQTILITQPFVLTNSKNYQEVAQNKLLATNEKGEPFVINDIFWFGQTGLLDIFKPQTQDWFWQQYKKHTLQGVGGWWGDLGEPEVHPSEIQHINGKADEVHNIYGHTWAKTIFEGYQKDFPNQRLFLLMRAGYAGSQKFGLIPWSGDVNRSWGGLKAQPSLSLNMGLTGMAYMHSDLGGFAGSDNYSPDLYLRWLQYGIFQPIFRPHSQEQVPSEPVFQSEEVKKYVKNIIQLRYQMIPYIYTMAWENSTKGTPLMRPLLWEDEKNEALKKQGNQYLWGKNILVAPILEDKQNEINVNFPTQNVWYDFFTHEKVNTNQKVLVQKQNIPVYVRAGAIIPTQILTENTRNTKEYLKNGLNLLVFADVKKSKSTDYLYIDDGKTPNADKNNQFALLQFERNQKNANHILITLSRKDENQFKPEISNVLKIKIIGIEIKSTDDNLTWDATAKTLTLNFDWQKKSKINIQVKNGVLSVEK